MRLQEIIGIVREYFYLALIVVIILGIIFSLGYFVVYRKVLGGRKRLSMKQLLLFGMLTCYIIMVIGVTFLNRNSSYQGKMDLSLFSTYREAWYSFSVRHWQFVYLNILMFVPFGMLLPLLRSRFQKAAWTIGNAMLFTLFIETVQILTGYGNFELDDLFNNLLGAVIGYGLIMGFISIKEKKLKQSFVHFSPLLLVIILSAGMFTYYYSKEFGNLSIVPTQRTNMSQATVTFDEQLDDRRKRVPIYKAPSYTKRAADEYVKDFFKRMHLDTSDMEDNSYPDEGIYWVHGEVSYNIWFRFLDGSYQYKDFSFFEEDKEPEDAEEETLKDEVMKFGIDIPKEADFQKVDTGAYEWTVDKQIAENQLIDGTLKVKYYNDHTVKEIDNQLITYDKVRDIQIKSEKEAYKEVLDGRFLNDFDNKIIKSLHINKIEISYYLDSKGYYQPIYAFHSTLNKKDITIFIPGIV